MRGDYAYLLRPTLKLYLNHLALIILFSLIDIFNLRVVITIELDDFLRVYNHDIMLIPLGV
jgi:hypothetical protein